MFWLITHTTYIQYKWGHTHFWPFPNVVWVIRFSACLCCIYIHHSKSGLNSDRVHLTVKLLTHRAPKNLLYFFQSSFFPISSHYCVFLPPLSLIKQLFSSSSSTAWPRITSLTRLQSLPPSLFLSSSKPHRLSVTLVSDVIMLA